MTEIEMPRVPVDRLVNEFQKNPTQYVDVVRIGKGSEGMTIGQAMERFHCGKDTVQYWRKVYTRAQELDEDRKLVTIQIPVKLMQKVKDQAQRIQFLEASLWRKTEEVEGLKTQIEGLKDELPDGRD
jgi:hypothetical protein